MAAGLFLLVAALRAIADVPEHLVTKLPGLEEPLATRHWSGYVNVQIPELGSNISVHYWLFESKKGLLNAPTSVWHNGGPGASSMMALFTENGPFTLNDQSFKTARYNESKIPSVFLNEFSWHTEANMLYVDHPAPAGFSDCTPSCPHWNDSTQAIVNSRFLEEFFGSLYPELQSLPFFMSGESYAGVLIPTTALLLLEARDSKYKNVKNVPAPYNLEGIALGNACPGNRIFTCTPYSGWLGVKVAVDFRYGHGMISPQTYELLQEACKADWNKYGPPENATCREILGDDPARPVMDEAGDTYQMGGGYFLYDHCGSDLLSVDPETGMPRQKDQTMDGVSLFDGNDDDDFDTNVYKCGQERAALAWIQLAEVQDAIHVERKPDFSFVTGLNYTFTKYSLLDEYKDTLSQRLRVMQYSGDADPCVPYVGTRRWIDGLGLPVKSAWKPWTLSGQVAGYRTVYQGGDDNTFTFTTIRNAGHMVPRHQPQEALHLFSRFLADEDLVG